MRQLFKLRPGSRRNAGDAVRPTAAPTDAPAADPPPPEPTVAWPPRGWWLKRLTAGYLLFVICLALLYWAWTAHSHRQLAAAIAAVHARGEPVRPEDFDPPPIPDDGNAAVLLTQAADRFKPDLNWPEHAGLSERGHDSVSRGAPLRFDEADVGAIDALIARNGPTLQLLRDAGRLAEADWGLRLRRRIIQIRLPHTDPQRKLAILLSLAALRRHARGDEAEALQLCRDLVRHGERLGQNAPFDVVQVTSFGSSSRALDVIQHLAPRLDLRRPTAARQAADALIADLLGERAVTQNWLLTCQAKRPWTTDIFVTNIEEPFILTKPMYRLDTARALRLRDGDVAAARSPTYPIAMKLLPPHPPPWDAADLRQVPSWRRGFHSVYPPRLLRHARILSSIPLHTRPQPRAYFRTLLDRRAAATLLAARMYQLDHDGQLPSRWDDLVPAYLPAVPRDPFRPDNAPLRLVRRYSDMIVYSVAEDGVDDGGAALDKYGRPTQTRWGTIDCVYALPASPDDAEQHQDQ